MNEATQTKRSKRIFQAGVSAVFCKGIVLGVSAVTVPIAVRYLGPEQFGIWMTISSTLALLILLDLGIASTITNLISRAYAEEDETRAGRYAATGFWVMVAIAVGLGVLGFLAWPLLHWNALFRLSGAENERMTSHAAAAAYGVFLVGLPAGLAAKFLAGYQEIKTANFFSAAGALANLTAVVAITALHGSMVMLVAGSAGAMVLVNLTCLAWLWIYHKPWLAPTFDRWQRDLVKPMMQSGAEFFVLQITGLVVFNSDNFVVAHYLGPAQVTPYSVTWRLVGYSAALQIIITPALWPAFTEAYVRRDFSWMRRTWQYVMLLTMGLAVACCVVLALWGRSLIRFWAGAAAVPDQNVLVLMCVWILISTFMANIATVLMATNETKLQAQLSVVAAALNLALSIWLVQKLGPAGVILGTILSYVLVLMGPMTWKVVQVLRTDPARQILAEPEHAL